MDWIILDTLGNFEIENAFLIKAKSIKWILYIRSWSGIGNNIY